MYWHIYSTFYISLRFISDILQDKYIKDIEQSIAVLSSTSILVFKEKEKLHYELQRIMVLQTDSYDANCVNNALDIELDMFYNNLDLNALRKIMLKGNVGLYRLLKKFLTLNFTLVSSKSYDERCNFLAGTQSVVSTKPPSPQSIHNARGSSLIFR